MPSSPAPSDPSAPSGGSARFWSGLGRTVGRRTGVVAAVTLIITAVLGLGLTKLEFTTGQDNYLNSDSQVAKDNVAYQNLFGGQAMIVLFTTKPGADLVDLFTTGNVEKFRDLSARLEKDPRIESVITPLTALQFTANLVTSPDGNPISSPAGQILLDAQSRDPNPDSAKRRLADSLRTLERINAIPADRRDFDDPDWADFLLHDNTGAVRKSLESFFPTDRTAQMIVRLKGNASIKEEGHGASATEAAMQDLTFDNADVMTTGAAVLLRDINDYLRGGFLTLGAISLVIMAGLLLVAFAVRWRLLPLGVVAVGLVWAFGLAGYLGVPLSVVTIAGMPVLLGVGIDFAVQLHSRVEEEAQLDRARDPVAEALARLMPALAVATVAGIVAFLALEFSKVPMIRDFGVLLAIGLPVIVVATVLLSAASLGFRERRSPTAPKDYSRGPLGRAVVALGSLPRVTAIPLVVLAAAIFAGGLVVEGDLKVQTDPEKWVSQDSQVVHDIQDLKAQTGSSSELGVYIQSGEVFDDRTVKFVHDFTYQQLKEHPQKLLTASSLVTTISFLMEVPDTTLLAPTGADIERAYRVTPEAIQKSTVNLDGKALNLIFRTGPGALEERAVVVDDIRATVSPPEGIRATPSGLAVVGTGLLENFEKNRVELTYFALIGVFLILLLWHRNIVRAVVSVIPVLIAVGLTAIVSWLAGFDLSPLTAVGGPLVIALCTEFTTLIVMRHIEERRRGRDPLAAIEEAAARTGRAFMVSALAAVIGIVVLAFSSLPLLRDFGLVVALNVGVALLSALVVLPPLLLWADERGWVYRGPRLAAGAIPLPTPAPAGAGVGGPPGPDGSSAPPAGSSTPPAAGGSAGPTPES
ncbi:MULTISPECIES: RND family transporter [unclassified Parafrankia]|uniref:efflux RND transporter permease subunit n=1 Tax=unclassified Parafrankia TaxID=2994368 RepID=UPI000DA4C607|nr:MULTISPECIES: MMPL family transporter [unclassified Parafrankia]TCJ35325.1 RND family transporter [Parafrankia sp. BMG5.11]SQD94775.1 MMPL domain protein [Parafrankia sp. Ea1.12]